MSISFVLITFLFQMSAGMALAISVLPVSIVDRQFYRSISFWAWLFTGLGLYFQSKVTFMLPETFGDYSLRFLCPSWLASWAFALLAFVQWFRIRWMGLDIKKWSLGLISFVGFLSVVLQSLVFRPAIEPFWVQNILLPLTFVTSSLVLGGFLAGMIFGHFYLVTVDMPKRLLITMAWILIAVMVLRIVAFGTTLFLYDQYVMPGTHFLTKLMSFQGHGIFFWQRVLVGLLIPSGVVALIHGTAKIGSNQSATGIMYVAIAFVFIGELVARYLFLLSTIPL